MFNKIVKISVLFLFVVMSTMLFAQTNGMQVATSDNGYAILYNNGSCIARASNGDLMVVYGTLADSMVYSKTYDSGFGTWNAAVTIGKGTVGSNIYSYPTVFADCDNHFLAAWIEEDKLMFSENDGTGWATAVQIPNTSAPWDSMECAKPNIDIDSDGNIWVAWQTDPMADGDEDFYISKSTDGGATWSDPDTLFKDVTPGVIPSGYGMPAIATGPNGVVGVTAREKDETLSTNYQMYFQEYDGSSWGDAMLLTTLHDSADVYQGNIDYDANGTCHSAIYTDENDWSSVELGQIYYSKKASGSTDWSVPVMISQDIFGKADYPAIAAGDNGALYVVYLGYGNGTIGESGFLRVWYTTSADGGITWTTASILDSTKEDMDLRGPSICKFVPGSGADVLFIAPDSTETDGYSIFYGNIPFVTWTSVEDNSIAESYELLTNYPNPFNPTTTIQFKVNTNDLVELEVFNISGRKVATLLNEKMEIGTYEVQFNSQGLSSGIFFVRLTNANNIATKKMVLIK